MEGQQPPPSSAGESPLYRLRVLSEPKGFLRIIEFFLAVFMFATTAGFSSSYSYSITCNDNPNIPILQSVKFSYPFELRTHKFPVYCDPVSMNPDTVYYTPTEPEGSARFFVCIGVLAMLYCMATIAWYVFLETKYLNLEFMPMVDVAVTAVFVLLFFIASCAWSAGVNDVKAWTNFGTIQKEFYADTCSTTGVATCDSTKSASYASLNVSLIFGFLNAAVWAGNVWFVLKETTWFRSQMQAKQGQQKPDPPTIEPPVNQL